MPIPKISAAQFETDLAADINNTADDLDTTYGPLPETGIAPQAKVFEAQNDRARQLSLMLAQTDPTVFDGFEEDLEGIVYNEGTTRLPQEGSETTLLFERTQEPTSDALVQRGQPIATQPDSTGEQIIFVPTESASIPFADRSSYFNIQTQTYQLQVPGRSMTGGASTRVGANRIKIPLRGLGQFDRVTNPTAATGGHDQETNTELIERNLLGVVGRQLGTPNGISRHAKALLSQIRALKIVYGNNALLTRAATDAGAVDAWVKGETLVQVTGENHIYLGVGQLIVPATQPVTSVVSVVSGANTYLEDEDYELVPDTSGVSRSPRAADAVRFLPGGPTTLPALGDVVTISYDTDNLLRELQAEFADEEVYELGRDLLFRRGLNVPMIHTANLRVRSGFSATDIQDAVETAVLALLDAQGFGGAVEESDIQGAARAITGTDNYITTRLTRSTVLAGVVDVTLEDNEYPTLAVGDYTTTLI